MNEHTASVYRRHKPARARDPTRVRNMADIVVSGETTKWRKPAPKSSEKLRTGNRAVAYARNSARYQSCARVKHAILVARRTSRTTCEETRERGMTTRDLIFHQLSTERSPRGSTGCRDGRRESRRDIACVRDVATHLYWHSLNITRGRTWKNYARPAPQRALSERHGSFLHNGRPPLRARSIDQFLRADNRDPRKRLAPSPPDAAQNELMRLLRIDKESGGSAKWDQAFQERRENLRVSAMGGHRIFSGVTRISWKELDRSQFKKENHGYLRLIFRS